MTAAAFLILIGAVCLRRDSMRAFETCSHVANLALQRYIGVRGQGTACPESEEIGDYSI